MNAVDLLNEQVGSTGIEDELRDLFAADGTIYLVSGFFTYNAFSRLRPDIESFLLRSAENELNIVVSAAADQFSPRIVSELDRLGCDDQITIYRYRDGFMHAKLYLRTGAEPTVILGSANLTTVAMSQNFELCVSFDPDDGELAAFRDFLDRLLKRCDPVQSRDLFRPLMIYRTAVNWLNKGRLISPRAVVRHPVRIALVLMVVASLWLLAV